ncbi:50S ribosomal protein L1 [Verrucomicrobia bacterium LW23]|nr:50S ribosomal protein L1 [Verrucomicrobia bacterium LW23]
MPAKRSKRYVAAEKLVDKKRQYSLQDAIALLKQIPPTKSDQTLDIAFHLGVDPRQSDQMVRGTVALPHGSGKAVRVLVFAQGAAAEAAKSAGAEYVGFEDLIKQVQEGFQAFDVVIATPGAMQEVRKLGKILGPRGLMPNPKIGTVTEDTGKAVKECKAGRVEFKVDKGANLHVVCGKLSFAPEAIADNTKAVIDAVLRSKPSTARGKYIHSATLASTFSPGLKLDVSSFLSA